MPGTGVVTLEEPLTGTTKTIPGLSLLLTGNCFTENKSAGLFHSFTGRQECELELRPFLGNPGCNDSRTPSAGGAADWQGLRMAGQGVARWVDRSPAEDRRWGMEMLRDFQLTLSPEADRWTRQGDQITCGGGRRRSRIQGGNLAGLIVCDCSGVWLRPDYGGGRS